MTARTPGRRGRTISCGEGGTASRRRRSRPGRPSGRARCCTTSRIVDLALVAEYAGTPLAFPVRARHAVLVESEPALVALAAGHPLRALEGNPLHRRLHLAWQPQRLPMAVGELLASIRDVYARQARANPAFAQWWSQHGWPSPPGLRVAGSPLGD